MFTFEDLFNIYRLFIHLQNGLFEYIIPFGFLVLLCHFDEKNKKETGEYLTL